jgi:hypothetical protein
MARTIGLTMASAEFYMNIDPASLTHPPIAVMKALDEADDLSSIFASGRVQGRGGSRSTRIDAEATDPKPPETKRGQKFRKMQKMPNTSGYSDVIRIKVVALLIL